MGDIATASKGCVPSELIEVALLVAVLMIETPPVASKQPPMTTTFSPLGVTASAHGLAGRPRLMVFVTVSEEVAMIDTVPSPLLAT